MRPAGQRFATSIEPAPGPPEYLDFVVPGFAAMMNWEPVRAVLEADGTVTIRTQQVPHGRGHETTLAQAAADHLGVSLEQIRVCFGDTRTAPFGLAGTASSRSSSFAGGATTLASRALRDRIVDGGGSTSGARRPLP